jgi:hypothetical protein
MNISGRQLFLYDVSGLTHGAGKLVETFGTENRKNFI